jgi:hypothetical protein
MHFETRGNFGMRRLWVIVLFVISSLSAPALAQQTMTKGDKNWDALEKTLWDAELQWLCVGQYHKAKAQECSDLRLKFKADRFFEIGQTGKVETKAEQAASQTKAAKVRPDVPAGQGANPQEFKLMAVYGDVALATDHTIYKATDASGKLAVTSEARVPRIFVKENGKWRPAAAALVRAVPQ